MPYSIQAKNNETMHIPEQEWSFKGVVGTFDRDALRRGYKVYKEVCSSCHSMKQLHFRNLGQKGGPEFSEQEVKALAKEYLILDGPDNYGDMFERARLPKDKFPAPFANQEAARAANNGAYPPDLSLIVKARNGGVDYLYALLTGYIELPKGMNMAQGMSYNPFFSNQAIAMSSPLSEDLVEYTDGTKADVEQMSRDVVTFLAWAAEPELEQRKKLGVMVFLYLSILAGLLYASMKKIWKNVK